MDENDDAKWGEFARLLNLAYFEDWSDFFESPIDAAGAYIARESASSAAALRQDLRDLVELNPDDIETIRLIKAGEVWFFNPRDYGMSLPEYAQVLLDRFWPAK